MRRFVLATLAVLGSSLLFTGCKGEDDQSPAAVAPPGVSRCQRGIQRAVKEPNASQATAIYYEECAELFTQAGCHDAWRAAAKLPASEQLMTVAKACRASYCPSLGAFSFEICRQDFKATEESVTRAWPPLFDAILSREAGPLSGQVSSSMLVMYAYLQRLPPPSSASAGSAEAPPGSASGEPAPSGAPATAPSGTPSAAPSSRAATAKPAASSKAAKAKRP